MKDFTVDFTEIQKLIIVLLLKTVFFKFLEKALLNIRMLIDWYFLKLIAIIY